MIDGILLQPRHMGEELSVAGMGPHGMGPHSLGHGAALPATAPC